MLRVRAGGVCALIACAAVLGCSDSKPSNGPVKGRVTQKGVPLADITVVFLRAESQEAVNAHTASDGSYVIVSHKDQGLPPGKYSVAVRPKNETKSDDEALASTIAKSKQKDPWAPVPKKQTSIPKKFHNPSTSGLTIEVASNENPPFDFDLPGK